MITFATTINTFSQNVFVYFFVVINHTLLDYSGYCPDYHRGNHLILNIKSRAHIPTIPNPQCNTIAFRIRASNIQDIQISV